MSGSAYNFGAATFAFFKTMGRRPGAVISIAVWQVLFYLALFVIAAVMFLPHVGAIVALAEAKHEPEPAQVLALFAQMGGAIFLTLVIGFALTLMVQGAWLRLLTRNEVASGVPFRFGGDELRLFVVNLLYVFFGFLMYIAIVIAVVAGSLVGALILNVAGEGTVTGGLLTGLWGFVAALAVMAVVIFLLIRFAAAPALTVRQKDIRFFESWSATKDVTGMMFLSYLVVILVSFGLGIIASVVQQIFMVGAMVSVIEPLSQLENTKGADVDQVMSILGTVFSNPVVIIALLLALVVQYIIQVIIEVCWHGVGAYAAVRYDGGDDVLAPAKPAPYAPSQSVGEAPSEG
ncbi:hypothetical protein [Woodsholea maritima]|uniref:hypothetical protein n=1 Tax=Woodsholea maritima TaxID=240237 RepID=UPI0003666780|nr:hypothetical protein [Woodsholea maritima]